MMFRILALLLLFSHGKASTHWVVTEDGRIQQQLESTFAMKKPDDLVSFIRQERTLKYLKEAKEKLLNEQSEIENNEDKDVELESRHYRRDPDCRAAGKRLPDFDLFISSVLPLDNKNIEISEHITIHKVASSEVRQPNCSASYDLPYSIHAYDHLEGVQYRHLLPPHPMSGLKTTLSFLDEPQEAATAIHEALQKNATSWVLYNLASFYWRMKGNSTEAVECIRRALHFSPEGGKDVALVNLANILHRALFTLNATVVMHHALEISSEFNINYFTLANMYAVLGEYNESIYYYEQTLKHQPDFDTAKKELAAVQCQLKLQEKLENQHNSLQRTLLELQKYKVKHEVFLQQQQHFTNLHLPMKAQVDQHMQHEHQRIKEGTFNHKCQVRTNKSGSVLVCNLPTGGSPSSTPLNEDGFYYHDDMKPIAMVASNNAEKKIEVKRTRKVKKPRGSVNTDDVVAQNDSGEFDGKAPVAQPEEKRQYKAVYDWTDPSWPPVKSCDDYINHYPVWDEFPSAYVDPETRGFKVRELLTSYIEVADGKMHPLPWTQPNCAHLEVLESTPYDHIVKVDSNLPIMKQDNFLQNFLLMHVNEGRVWPDDLGQRILTAIQKAIREEDNDHLWALYNLAGLYWRVYGDNANAIECLRRSAHHVPLQNSDIPLVSLSNIMYRLGRINDAVHLLIFALHVNNSEPATYLSMGNALQAQDNITGAIEFYNYAMVLHPQYKEAFHSLLIVKCYNLTRKAKQEKVEEIISKWNSEGSEAANVKKLNVENDSNVDDEVDGEIISKLISGKSDADVLLRDTDDVIHDLLNASTGELDEKMVTARQLMEKLTEMRNSLGHLVDEASSTLGGSKESSNLDCEIIIPIVDFNFATNTSYLQQFRVIIPDQVQWDSLEPVCVLESRPELYDVINMEDIRDGASEDFAEILRDVVGGGDLDEVLRSGLLSDSASWKVPFVTSYFWRISGESKKAMTCLLRSLVNAPTEDDRDVIIYVISDYLAFLSRYDDAIKVANQVNDVDRSAHVQYLLGNVHAAKGDYVLAVKHFKSVVELNPHFADCQIRFKAASCLSRP